MLKYRQSNGGIDMAYEDYEISLVKCFGDEVDSGIIRLDNNDIQSNKARTKYNRYISS